MSGDNAVECLRQHLGDECFSGELFIQGKKVFVGIDKKCLIDAVEFLRKNGFVHLSAITALETDHGFELLYHLSNEEILLTLRVKLPKKEAVAPSITNIIRGGAIYEQENHDLFGVEFDGNPNLEPLILPDDWPRDVYPLRKRQTSRKSDEENADRNPDTKGR